MSTESRELWIDRLLRASVAFVFLYPALNGFVNPDAWIGYFPPFLLNSISETMLVSGWGVIEIILALWILSGKKIAIPSIIATILIVGIVVFNPSQFIIIFRDLSLAGVTAALAIKHWNS